MKPSKSRCGGRREELRGGGGGGGSALHHMGFPSPAISTMPAPPQRLQSPNQGLHRPLQ